MTVPEIIKYRLHNQQLSQQVYATAQEATAWMGAIQAQDYGAAKWGLGQRVAGAHDNDIEEAFTRGDILRTHVMRPTWHFVAPTDIRWMQQLTAKRVIAQCAHAYRMFELDSTVFKRSHKALEYALQGGKYLARTDIAAVLQKAKVNTSDLRFIHLMMRAELDGIVCSGPRQGKQFTYALLEERVPAAKALTQDEALAKLTTRYFNSHAPATLHDFVWWAGLTLTMAKEGMELVKSKFISESIGGQTYWFSTSMPAIKVPPSRAYLLPNYDEYVVAYKDRTALMDLQHMTKLDSRGNALFNNVIVINGRVAGLWKRTVRTNDVIVETMPFEPLSKVQNTAIAKAVKEYKKFML